jgi:hypothetical protein
MHKYSSTEKGIRNLGRCRSLGHKTKKDTQPKFNKITAMLRLMYGSKI